MKALDVTKVSDFTGKVSTRSIPGITREQLDTYYKGHTCIQNVFPHLSADDREFIMTGVTPEEWDEAFGKY